MGQPGQSRTRGYQSILCAVDFSLQASAALEVAASIARRTGGHVTVLCVEDAVLSTGAAAAGYDKSLLQKATLQQLNRLVTRVAGSVGLSSEAWTARTVMGNPAVAIPANARELNADLIVMGTNGRRGPAKFFFGSVAEAVLKRTPVPVLVVPRSRPGRAPSLRAPRVVGAIELGPNERSDARRIADAAKALGGRLTLLHVVRPAPRLPALAPELDERRQLETVRKRLDPIARGAGAASQVAIGHPEDEIASAAERMNAGLVVLALRRGHGLFGPRQGSTTYRLLSTTTIPVLGIPPVASR